jgi:hypothetical protein
MTPRFILLPLVFLLSLYTSYAQTSTVTYNTTQLDFVNPDRGFYYPTITYASNHSPLVASNLMDKRTNYFTPWQANYDVRTSLVFRYFVLDDFKNSPISAAYLSLIEADFNTARSAGVKLIVRFSYINSTTDDPNNANCTICPPYGDADKARVLEHIGQLKDLLHKHGDIISTVQMGFIGIWGEQYYTDFFGDASPVGNGYLTVSNWDDRIEVLDSLLRAVPKERMVQVRYPQMKQKYVYGSGAATDPAASPPLASILAYDFSDAARIGFHNDCFLASPYDFGTFANYDQNTASQNAELAFLRSYKGDDSKYTVVGGETCFNDTFLPDRLCASAGGRADSDMDLFHYTYLNSDYNNEVNNNWVNICMDDVKKFLGYRLYINSGTYQDQVDPGESFSVSMDIVNDGYAAMHNQRLAELVLVETSTGEKYYGDLQSDPRTWEPGMTTTVAYDFCTPSDMISGQYALYLNLADPNASLYDRPEYAVRLAHTNGWDAITGYNDLQHTLTITNNPVASACSEALDIREAPVITNILSTDTPEIVIYPNPIENYFVIKGDLSFYTVEIIDALGSVYQTLIGANTITINTYALPSGMYFVRVSNNNNALICVDKIIKN